MVGDQVFVREPLKGKKTQSSMLLSRARHPLAMEVCEVMARDLHGLWTLGATKKETHLSVPPRRSSPSNKCLSLAEASSLSEWPPASAKSLNYGTT